MKAYEIQLHKDGKWKVDSIFDDGRLAKFEAGRIVESRRYGKIRVIEENYDEASGLTTTRTIFRGGWANEKHKKPEPAARKQTIQANPKTGGGEERTRKSKRPPAATKSSNMLVPFLIFSLVILGGIAAMLGLNILSQMK